MSTISSSGLTATSSVSRNGSGALQITGLASGLDTNAIISALVAVDQKPITNLQNAQSSLRALNNALTGIQSTMQTVALNAQALGDPSLFTPTQNVTSSNSALVTASSTNGVGAVVGGSTVAVTQLASAAQRTYSFTSPTSADTITIDGQQISLAAGASAQDLADAINSNGNVDVWASPTQTGSVVLSARSTGNNGTNFIQVSDPAAVLTEQTALAQNGQNAQYTINNVAGSSTSDTVKDAIPGVTLTLSGVTGSTSPVTINVQPPGPNTSSIEAAINTFVQSYNSAIGSIQSQVTTKPATGNAGQLFGDTDLLGLLGNMRSSMYTPGAGLPAGMASLANIGITTGSASGGGQFSQSSVQGNLTVNTATLEKAIQSNPSGVEKVLQSWASAFSTLVNNVAGPGGSLDARSQGDSQEISRLGEEITSKQAILTARQTALQAQFAKLESTLSKYQAQGSWLASQISSLPAG